MKDLFMVVTKRICMCSVVNKLRYIFSTYAKSLVNKAAEFIFITKIFWQHHIYLTYNVFF